MKFCGVLISFHEVTKLQSYKVLNFLEVTSYLQNVQYSSPLTFLDIFVSFMEKEPAAKFCRLFDHFSRIYEVRKF